MDSKLPLFTFYFLFLLNRSPCELFLAYDSVYDRG